MREMPQGRLNPKVKSVWRIRNLIGAGSLALICVIAALITAFALRYQGVWPWALFAIVLVLAIAYVILRVIVIPNLAFSRWRYAVDQEEVDLVHGVIIRRRSIIPLVRVQHVDTKQGPILRAFGLASVSIATAAGAHEIPGLLLDEADALRDKVAVLARIAQEDM